MSHPMKLWRQLFEHILGHETTEFRHQFGFLLGRCIREVIFLLRFAMEKYKEMSKDLIYSFLQSRESI